MTHSREVSTSGTGAAGKAPPGAPASPPGAAAPPAAAALPAGVERLRQAALGSEPKSDMGLSTIVRYFKAEDGSTRTVVVIAVKKSDVSMGADGKPITGIVRQEMVTDKPADSMPLSRREGHGSYSPTRQGEAEGVLTWRMRETDHRVVIPRFENVDLVRVEPLSETPTFLAREFHQ